MSDFLWFLLVCLLYQCDALILVRLVGGKTRYEGRVEVSMNGTDWGTVCTDGWSDLNAHVVCRQLGMTSGYGAARRARYRFGMGTGAIHLDNVECDGTERSLEQCKHAPWGQHNCVHTEDAAVTCHSQNVRLERGPGNHGVLYVLNSDKKWAVQCGGTFTNIAASVVCKQLGFVSGIVLPVGTYGAVKEHNRYINARINCKGHEKNIQECIVPPQDECAGSPYNYAAVYCRDGSPLNQSYAVSISAEIGFPYVGAVMVRFRGLWSYVCGSHWDDIDAAVVCREMGYTGGIAFNPVHGSPPQGPFIGGMINCRGTEDTLIKCASSAVCEQQGPIKVAGVLCHNTSGISIVIRREAYVAVVSQAPKLRLVEEMKMLGRLEIEMDGEVGGICDHEWDVVDARVSCQQLGYADGDNIRGMEAGYKTMFLSNVECVSGEKSIFECKSNGWRKGLPSECRNKNNTFAGIECYHSAYLASSQESPLAIAGRLLTFHNERWYYVCDENFNEKAADLACKEMGYHGGTALPARPLEMKNEFGIFFLGLECRPYDKKLSQCIHTERSHCRKTYRVNGVNGNLYQTDSYASMVCFKRKNVDKNRNTNMKILRPTGFPYTPVVEMYGIRGTICAMQEKQMWSENDANTFCKHFNYNKGYNSTHYEYVGPEMAVTPVVWMTNVTCLGAASPTINSCLFSRFKQNDLPCRSLAFMACT